jgi:hypothetical protein
MLKQNFDITILYELLEKICEKINDLSNNFYIIDMVSFKRLEYYDILNTFVKKVEPYYINSKKFYVTRKLDYNKFLTLIRQICKFSNINYYSKISYDKSKYFIKYYIEIV